MSKTFLRRFIIWHLPRTELDVEVRQEGRGLPIELGNVSELAPFYRGHREVSVRINGAG